jgi:hypothetical protein
MAMTVKRPRGKETDTASASNVVGEKASDILRTRKSGPVKNDESTAHTGPALKVRMRAVHDGIIRWRRAAYCRSLMMYGAMIWL